jgi:two-component system, cell cycle response regulator
MGEWSVEFLRGVLDAAPEGIVVCAAGATDRPVVYLNSAFERLSGYGRDELIGQDLRRLQAWDREQEGRVQLRAALAKGESCRVLLRNYRKDGTPFWNELLVQPIRDADGTVSHFVGFHRDVSERERSALRRAPGLPSWLREDRLSGLCSRAYFEELLSNDWKSGLREPQPLMLLAFDIDELGSYNDTFGRAAGDACIRRVAGVIGGAFRRGADVVARWDGGCILALVRHADPATAPTFAGVVAQKVLNQHIHHPRAQRQKFVSVSVGVVCFSPEPKRSADGLVQAALRAMRRAKGDRKTQVALAGPEEVT